MWKKATSHTKSIINNAVYEANIITPVGTEINLTIVKDGREFTAMHGMARMNVRATLKEAKFDTSEWLRENY